MASFRTVAILLLLAMSAGAAVPPPPPDGILDPLDAWSSAAKKNMVALRNHIRRERGYHIYFAAIGVPEGTSADQMAQELLNAWSPREPGAVFLSLIDKPGLGMAVSDGKTRPTEERIDDVRMYLFTNRRSDSSATILEAAANQLVSDLSIQVVPEKAPVREAWNWTARYPEILSLLGAILTICLGIYLMNLSRHSNFFGLQKRFPIHPVNGRFGGQNSGGYGVMIDFGAAPGKPQERSETDY